MQEKMIVRECMFPPQLLSCSDMQTLRMSRSKGSLDQLMNDGVAMLQKTCSAISSVCRTFKFQQCMTPGVRNHLRRVQRAQN